MKNIFAEILTIGDEILYGQITDTNSKFISQALDQIGIKVKRMTSIGDEESEILEALAEAEKRVDIVLITGGLGPTKDDITKKTLAQFFDTELVEHPEALKMITDYFERRKRVLPDNLRQQAMMPENCEVLFNRLGTAPAMWFNRGGKAFVSMPGVPQEMEILIDEMVIPKIKTFFKTPVIYHKVIRTFGAGESMLSQVIEQWEDNLPSNLKLAYLPTWGEVKLRITAIGPDRATLETQVEEEIQKVVPLIQKYIYGYDRDELESIVGDLLKEQGKTISTAESCTGGFIGHLITKIAGSSAYYEGGVISYSNAIKMSQLGVPSETLDEHGAVSEETIIAMAEGVRKRFNTDIGVASSGVAGPGGGSPDKPVGTVWIAYSDGVKTSTRKLSLTTDRLINIRMTSYIVLDLIRRKLSQNEEVVI